MLVAVHDAFRGELALIRREVAASGAGVGAQLRVNCLTLCQGLGNHHMGEEQQMFPLLERRHPELAPALARLKDEHETVKGLLDERRLQVGTSQKERHRAILTSGSSGDHPGILLPGTRRGTGAQGFASNI